MASSSADTTRKLEQLLTKIRSSVKKESKEGWQGLKESLPAIKRSNIPSNGWRTMIKIQLESICAMTKPQGSAGSTAAVIAQFKLCGEVFRDTIQCCCGRKLHLRSDHVQEIIRIFLEFLTTDRDVCKILRPDLCIAVSSIFTVDEYCGEISKHTLDDLLSSVVQYFGFLPEKEGLNLLRSMVESDVIEFSKEQVRMLLRSLPAKMKDDDPNNVQLLGIINELLLKTIIDYPSEIAEQQKTVGQIVTTAWNTARPAFKFEMYQWLRLLRASKMLNGDIRDSIWMRLPHDLKRPPTVAATRSNSSKHLDEVSFAHLDLMSEIMLEIENSSVSATPTPPGADIDEDIGGNPRKKYRIQGPWEKITSGLFSDVGSGMYKQVNTSWAQLLTVLLEKKPLSMISSVRIAILEQMADFLERPLNLACLDDRLRILWTWVCIQRLARSSKMQHNLTVHHTLPKSEGPAGDIADTVIIVNNNNTNNNNTSNGSNTSASCLRASPSCPNQPTAKLHFELQSPESRSTENGFWNRILASGHKIFSHVPAIVQKEILIAISYVLVHMDNVSLCGCDSSLILSVWNESSICNASRVWYLVAAMKYGVLDSSQWNLAANNNNNNNKYNDVVMHDEGSSSPSAENFGNLLRMRLNTLNALLSLNRDNEVKPLTTLQAHTVSKESMAGAFPEQIALATLALCTNHPLLFDYLSKKQTIVGMGLEPLNDVSKFEKSLKQLDRYMSVKWVSDEGDDDCGELLVGAVDVKQMEAANKKFLMEYAATVFGDKLEQADQAGKDKDNVIHPLEFVLLHIIFFGEKILKDEKLMLIDFAKQTLVSRCTKIVRNVRSRLGSPNRSAVMDALSQIRMFVTAISQLNDLSDFQPLMKDLEADILACIPVSFATTVETEVIVDVMTDDDDFQDTSKVADSAVSAGKSQCDEADIVTAALQTLAKFVKVSDRGIDRLVEQLESIVKCLRGHTTKLVLLKAVSSFPKNLRLMRWTLTQLGDIPDNAGLMAMTVSCYRKVLTNTDMLMASEVFQVQQSLDQIHEMSFRSRIKLIRLVVDWLQKHEKPDDLIRLLQSKVLKFQKDIHPMVRFAVSEVVGDLFKIWPGHYSQIFDDISADIPIAGSLGTDITTAVTLGRIACVCEPLEAEILFRLCRLCGAPGNHQYSIVQRTMTAISDVLRCGHLTDLLEAHFPSIIRRWVEADIPLQELPFKLMGFETLSELLLQYAKVFLPLLLLQNREDTMHTFARWVRRNTAELLKSEFVQIVCRLFPLFQTSDSGENAADQVFVLVAKLVGFSDTKDVGKLVASNIEKIVISTWDLVSYNGIDENVVCYREEIISAAVKNLAARSQRSVIQMLVGSDKSHERLYKIIMRMFERFQKATRCSVRLSVVIAVETLCHHLQDFIVNKWVIRLIFHILVCALHKRVEAVVRRRSEEALGTICALVQQHPSPQIDLLLKPVIAALIPLCETEPESSELLAKILQLFPDCMYSCLELLYPLPSSPSTPSLWKPSETITTLWEQKDLQSLLQQIVEDLPYDSSTANLRTMESLARLLDTRRDQLLQMIRIDDPRGVLCVLSSKLLLLCRMYPNSPIRDDAIRCLGLLGIAAPSAIAFPSLLHRIPLPKHSAVWSFDDITLSAKVAVIFFLSGILCDVDCTVVLAASRLLKKIFEMPERDQLEAAVNNTHPSIMPYLEPFISSKPSSSTQSSSAKAKPSPPYHEQRPEAMWCTKGKSYSSWISNIAAFFAYESDWDLFWPLCAEICMIKPAFGELILPFLLFSVTIKKDNPHTKMSLSELISKHVLCSDPSSSCNVAAIGVILQSLEFCRWVYFADTRADNISKKKKVINANWKQVFWFDLDYLLVAKAASAASSHFTAFVYVELWCEHRFGHLSLEDEEGLSQSGSDAYQAEALLLEICRKINEPDTLYSFATRISSAAQLASDIHEGHFASVIREYDTRLQVEGSQNFESNAKGLLYSLKSQGYEQTALMCLLGISTPLPPVLSEDAYEAAWRATKWDLPLEASGDKRDSFQRSLHLALRALYHGNGVVCEAELRKGRECALKAVASAEVSGVATLFSSLVNMQCLSLVQAGAIEKLGGSVSSIDAVIKATTSSSAASTAPDTALQHVFVSTYDRLSYINNWELCEPILAVCGVVLKIMKKPELMCTHWQRSASLALQCGRLQAARGFLQKMSAFDREIDVSDVQKASYYLVLAKNLWLQGSRDRALQILRTAGSKLKEDHWAVDQDAAELLTAKANLKWAKYAAETRAESGAVIREALQSAVETIRVRSSCPNTIAKAYFSLAHHCDTLLQHAQEIEQSPEHEELMKFLDRKRSKLAAVQKGSKTAGPQKKDKDQIARELEREIKGDLAVVEATKEERRSALNITLQSYTESLCHADGTVVELRSAFRLCGLWFSHSSDPEVMSQMSEAIKKIPPKKFAPLMHQLAARLGSNDSSDVFMSCTATIVEQLGLVDPCSSLWHIHALAQGDRVPDDVVGKSLLEFQREKIDAARIIWQKLKSNKSLRNMCEEMEILSDGYVELAFLKTDKDDIKAECPLTGKLRRMKALDLVPVVTCSDAICNGKVAVSIQGFQEKWKFIGGINVPKIVTCYGSDGLAYRQLVKGRDDTRQDAVMQQLFGVINRILSADKKCRRRGLMMRTYKILPLCPQAGVIEFVEDTMTIGEYLVAKGPKGSLSAHARYDAERWKKFSSAHCRFEMQKAAEAAHEDAASSDRNPHANKQLQVFNKICENFRPVMHYFFLENYDLSWEWFEKRLEYSRSVAASSMIGFVAGLGDRHTQNILISTSTAQIIHIDFGITFEQGKNLITPEKVPFRLTRDIVDGLGVGGTAGVFQRCCEETLRVLRNNKDSLLTVVEVLVYDPLCRWMRKVESDEDEEEKYGNLDAKRALLKVKQKLQGFDHGEYLSVEGQVKKLICEAQNPENLCQMFHGWLAWV